MPKQKTRRSAAKRFKTTGSGKLRRRQAWRSHLVVGKKSSRRLRRLQGDADVMGSPTRYPEGRAEISAVTVVLPPGGETGWHSHPVPLFARVVEGTINVPNFMDDAGAAPGSNLNYDSSDPDALPVQFGGNGTLEVPFICIIPQVAFAEAEAFQKQAA